MNARRWVLVVLGLLLVALSLWQIGAARHGLEVIHFDGADPPLTVVRPEGLGREQRPLVLVGHGFAGSRQVMYGFAYTLAHAGYEVALWDFDGHAANPYPLSESAQGLGSGRTLLGNAQAALAKALAEGYGDPQRVAILGHSMGSGVALSFGREQADTAATIAVSPVARAVTPTLPRNLLLMAGSLEPAFLGNAEDVLAQAGGEGGDPAAGTARKLATVPGVEHISILFSPTAHAAARDWLDATFGPQPGARPYTDRRMVWYLLGQVGALLAAVALAPLVREPAVERAPVRPLWRRLAALAGGALGATLLLWLAGEAGLALRDLLGLTVGGYLLLWFGVAGGLGLLLLWVRPPRLTLGALPGALLVFAALWLGLGLLGNLVWLPWLLIPRRLILWPLGVLLSLPWFLAVGQAQRGSSALGRLGWWLAHSGVVVGAMLLALRLSPDLGFLMLILPLFPVILGVHALVAAPYRGSWPYALSGALFQSWVLLVVFPLQ
jgi:dienelactone hydrolase